MIQGIYPIVDSSSVRPDLSEIELARLIVNARPRQIQLRLKMQTDQHFYSIAREVRKITKIQGVLMIINDRVDIALAVMADGVHLGPDDLPPGVARELLGKGKIVGISTGSLAEVEAAAGQGADYIAFGPVFETSTKQDSRKSPQGLETLRRVVVASEVPVVAIGGIREDNLAGVVETGVAGVAMISSITSTSDITGNISKFKEVFTHHRKN